MKIWMLILIYVGTIIILSCIIGELRFRYLKRQELKEKENKENNEKDEEESTSTDNGEGFHRVDYRVSKNCRNQDSYGVVCVKCGQCGRKF